MKIPLYQVDSFTSEVFSGNPACVVPLKEWLPDTILLKPDKEYKILFRVKDNDPYISKKWIILIVIQSVIRN